MKNTKKNVIKFLKAKVDQEWERIEELEENIEKNDHLICKKYDAIGHLKYCIRLLENKDYFNEMVMTHTPNLLNENEYE